MTGARVLRVALRGLAVAIALALAALVAVIAPSPDNGPYMTPFAITLVALATVLILLGYAGGLTDSPAAPEGPDEPSA
jgi:hypothetical protein